jgi:hypothetical protein
LLLPKPSSAEVLAQRQAAALLQLLDLSQQDVEAGRVRPLNEVVERLRAKLRP